MGLRIDEGISMSRYEELAGQTLETDVLEHLLSDGLLLREGGKLKATMNGRLVLNRVTQRLLLS